MGWIFFLNYMVYVYGSIQSCSICVVCFILYYLVVCGRSSLLVYDDNLVYFLENAILC